MTEYRLVEVTPEHIAELVANMREEDRAEVEAIGDSPLEAIERSVMDSAVAGAWTVDGEAQALFGLATPVVLGQMAMPWILTGKGVPAHRKTFFATARRIIEGWAQEYPLLVNYVDSRYKQAIRFSKHLGFEDKGHPPLYMLNVPFVRMERRR